MVSWSEQAAVAQRLAGHWLAGDKQLLMHHLVCICIYNHCNYYPLFFPLLPYSVLVNSFYLNPQALLCFLPLNSLPHPTGRGGSEPKTVWH